MRSAEKHLVMGTWFPSKHLMMIFRFKAASTERPIILCTCAPPTYMLENSALQIFLRGKGGVKLNVTVVGNIFIHTCTLQLAELSVSDKILILLRHAHEFTDLRTAHMLISLQVPSQRCTEIGYISWFR